LNNSEKYAGLNQAQLDAHWMPFSGNRDFKKAPRLFVSAEGSYFTSADGRKVFDALSGLWTCGAGHGRPEISEAISKQIKQLDYAPSFNFGHPRSFELAERIAQLMPKGLNRVFFTNSGSESVDTSLKIARAYWHKQGLQAKTKLIGRIKGYHGVNFGGISVGGIVGNRALFGETIAADHLQHTMLPENRFVKGLPETGADRADELLELIALHDASTIAAVIIEPLAGSAGVLPPPRGYLKRIRDICDQHNILLIFDEVITAFGRMGWMTGSEAFGVVPDIITTAKQLTNGTVPMGAVICRQEIYDTFMREGGFDYAIELRHGYTYSAHPVACAAGLAALDILEKDGLIHCVREIAPFFEQQLHLLKAADHVVDIRNYGVAGALSIEHVPGEPMLRPYLVAMSMWKKGFYVRYASDTIQLGLPFIVEREEIDKLISALGETLDELK